jgi:hypothetical protein
MCFVKIEFCDCIENRNIKIPKIERYGPKFNLFGKSDSYLPHFLFLCFRLLENGDALVEDISGSAPKTELSCVMYLFVLLIVYFVIY